MTEQQVLAAGAANRPSYNVGAGTVVLEADPSGHPGSTTDWLHGLELLTSCL